jgi:molecular chaperone GrpE
MPPLSVLDLNEWVEVPRGVLMSESHKPSNAAASATAASALPPDSPGDAATEGALASRAADPASDLADLLHKAEAEAAELKDAWLRARADVDNVRRQAANDVARAHKFAIERFAEDVLPVRDALESALVAGNTGPEALRAGVLLTLKQLDAALEKARVVEIDPLGQKFDPHRHQAMAMIESDQPARTVVQVLQKGYLLNDRVLRPAMVAVSKDSENDA